MYMKSLVLSAFAASSMLLSAANAMGADVNVIHGIDGRDLGLSQELPVDISVNGACALTGVTFKQSAKVELGAGDYLVKVFVSSGSCEGTPVIEKQVTISEQNEIFAFSLVASLSRSGTPQLAVFQNSYFPGVAIRHLAKAGPVNTQISARSEGLYPEPAVKTIRNGQQAPVFILSNRFDYRATVAAQGLGRLASLKGSVRRGNRILYVVGSAANGFSIISETVRYSAP